MTEISKLKEFIENGQVIQIVKSQKNLGKLLVIKLVI